jgi:hypothetical protein
MEEFNFEIILNHCMSTCTIKPPSSYNALIQIICEKFDLAKINKIVYLDDDEEVRISTDADYLNFFDFIDSNKLKEIEILIKSDQEKGKRKKSLRKNSRTFKAPIKESAMNHDDGCVNGNIKLTLDHFDADFEADVRNPKFIIDEEMEYNKHSYNFTDQKRIHYIKLKKEMQREEQSRRHNDDGEDSTEEVDRSKKRQIKTKKAKEVFIPEEDNKKKKNKK